MQLKYPFLRNAATSLEVIFPMAAYGIAIIVVPLLREYFRTHYDAIRPPAYGSTLRSRKYSVPRCAGLDYGN
jgi:hypothetical protein